MTSKKKDKGEQVSHKIIEKRRRDRINNCLNILSQTIPSAFIKSSGKLEKAEILEMTVEYLRAINNLGQKLDQGDWLNPLLYAELQRYYSSGYSECVQEVFRYITEVEGMHVTDTRCTRIMTYLQTKGAGLVDAVAVVKKMRKLPSSQPACEKSTHGLAEIRPDIGAHASIPGYHGEQPAIANNYLPLSANGIVPNSSFSNLNRLPAGHCFGCHPCLKSGPNFQYFSKTQECPLETYPSYRSPMATDAYPHRHLYSRHLPSSLLTYGLMQQCNATKDATFANNSTL